MHASYLIFCMKNEQTKWSTPKSHLYYRVLRMNKLEQFHCQDLHLKQENNINLIDTKEEKNNFWFLTTFTQNFAEANKKKCPSKNPISYTSALEFA